MIAFREAPHVPHNHDVHLLKAVVNTKGHNFGVDDLACSHDAELASLTRERAAVVS